MLMYRSTGHMLVDQTKLLILRSRHLAGTVPTNQVEEEELFVTSQRADLKDSEKERVFLHLGS